MLQGETDQPIHLSPVAETEDAMTLQIGLIGRNGFVIASDRLVQNKASGSRAPMHSSRTDKIQVFDQQGLVIAYAGQNPPTSFGYRLRDAWASPPNEIITREAREWFAANPTSHATTESEIIVGHKGDATLWHVVGKGSQADVISYSDKISTRNTMSLAPFMAEHFCSPEMSISAMETLAALTIWYGERQGNTTIRGLGGVTCENGEIREWNAEKIAKLRKQCENLHDKINRLLLR
jgi:hypothetical protein